MSDITLDSLVYQGSGTINGVSRWTERSAGLPKYFRNLTSSVNVNTASDRVNIKWKLVLPFPESAPSECPCVGENPYADAIVDVSIRLDARVPQTMRENIVDAIQSLVATTQFAGSVEALVNPI